MSSAAFGNGRYVSTGESFSGGMAQVHLCTDTNLERTVAIKFLGAHADRRRIHDEVAALQQLRSKHVVQIYDVVVEPPNNSVGLVEEFLPGMDLEEWRDSRTLSQEELLRVVYQLATGLADVHHAGLIHRDIKPNNARFDDENLLKLFDFNLARDQERGAETLGFRGTPGFAAPELYIGGTVRFTTAVDVYALAATIVAVAEGTLPSEAVHHPTSVGSPRFDGWLARGGFGAHLPDPLASALDRSLATNPGDRPSAARISDVAGRLLLENRHRAVLSLENRAYVLSSSKRTVNLQHHAGSLTVSYDGFRFTATAVSGEVRVNNERCQIGAELPGSCVISLGESDSNDRTHIRMDQSSPEVIL